MAETAYLALAENPDMELRTEARLLRDLIGSGQPTLGNSVGTSFGRLVAPVTVNDMDAGLSMLRDGQTLSAPSHLTDP